MRVLADEESIQRAQTGFRSSIANAADEELHTTIGHPNGQIAATVYWIAREDLWAYFGPPPEEMARSPRYWNVFGFGKPGASVSITCEINPPIRGINRRPAGAFAESAGEIHLLHRGNFNAFRGRIPNEFARRNFNGTWISAEDGDRESDFLNIGRLSDPQFVTALREFVAEATRLKEIFKSQTRPLK